MCLQVLDLSVSQGHAVASNELGHVVHFTPAGDELWREKSGGEQGWMVSTYFSLEISMSNQFGSAIPYCHLELILTK